MPVNVEEDLVDGLRIVRTERGYQLTRTFFCTDLEGATPLEKFVQPYFLTAAGDAHTGANIPERLEVLTVRGINFYCNEIEIDPDPPADATVRAIYLSGDTPGVAGFGPVVQEAGSTLELGETRFDAANRELAYASRVGIQVNPPATHTGQPPQFPTVPYFAGKATRIYTRQESSDPLTRSKAYVAKTNSTVWKTEPEETVMCAEIFGRNSGDGIWITRYVFVFDPEGKFRGVSFWRDPNGQVVEFDPATNAGVTESVMQQTAEFNDLNL